MSPPVPVAPAGGDLPGWESPTRGTELPYDFVPVLPASMQADEPVWHDGSYPDPDALYSGELHCTLTTLTPTIVGNQQFALQECTDEVKTMVARAMGNAGRPKDDKKLLLPLCAGDPNTDPILIPGEGLAGMVRHAVGALLNAPMERVDAANFSYRPNVRVPAGQVASRPMAAEVVRFDRTTRALEIKLITNILALEFVHGNDAGLLPGPTPQTLAAGYNAAGWIREPRGGARHRILRDAHANLTLGAAYRALRYQFGLDGVDGYHKKTDTSNERGIRPHPSVLVPAANIAAASITVDPAVVTQYLDTNEHLRDGLEGHRARAMIADPNNAGWQPVVDEIAAGDLIFCEVLAAQAGVPARVVSFGRNFRYRWRHLDSITERAIEYDDVTKAFRFEVRPEMKPHAREVAAADGRPAALTAVRNMFGYVVDAKRAKEATPPPAPAGPEQRAKPRPGLQPERPDLADPFNRMAGRVSFNFAMERLQPGETAEQRFVNAAQQALVFLHPTAAPKPQFARAYVPGGSKTWGEGLLRQGGKLLVQGGTRHFAGRKFYPPQGYDPQLRRFNLPAYHYDLLALRQAGGQVTALNNDELTEQLVGNQAAVARWVSAAGRSFGFTVRFKQLRGYELAALVAALEPQRLATAGGEGAFQHGFALKLGHGRALGMGTVAVSIDSGVRWPSKLGDASSPIDLQHLDGLIKGGLVPKTDPSIRRQWLSVLSRNPGRTLRPYMHAHGNMTMTAWCTDQRLQALQERREAPLAR